MTNINALLLRPDLPADCRAWLLLLSLCWALAGQAGSLPVQRAYWVDASGTADLALAQQQQFAPAPEILALGYGAAPVWLRVTVPPSPLPELLLMVKPAVLDDVRLYVRTPGSHGAADWQMRQQGDQFAFSQRERQDLNFSFVITPSATARTELYVRVHSTSSRAIYVSVNPLSEAEKSESLVGIGIAMYLGLTLLLAFFSLVQAVVKRDRLWALNTVVQVLMIGWVLAHQGYHAKFIGPDHAQWCDLGYSAMYSITMWMLYFYYREFAIAFNAPTWLVTLLALAMLPLPWQLWAIWHDQVRQALQLTSTLLLFRTLSGFFLVWFFVIEDRNLRYMVRFLHISQSLYGSTQVAPWLGLGDMTESNLYPAILFNLFGAGMQYLVLTRRDWLQQREKSQLRRRVHDAEQKLRWEQQRLQESASFMAMLLHELKNPLASIRLAVQTLQQTGSAKTPQEQALRLGNINQSIDGIDAVMERCRQVDRLEQGQWSAEKCPLDVVPLVLACIAASPQSARVQADLPAQWLTEQDPSLLRTIVMNLLDNALAYSPPGSQVMLQLHENTAAHGHWLTLTLRNAVGKAGLPDADRVFGKYYRADRAHQRTGSGLGLFLVKGLAQLAGGDVTHRVEITAAGATQVVFELSLPCQ